MKKIIYLMMAVVLPFMFVGCSDDDENNFEDQLVGTWVEETEYTDEVLHMQLNADHTGLYWAEDNGEVDRWGKRKLLWRATENEFTGTWIEENTEFGETETLTLPYYIKDGKLYLDDIVYRRK